MRSENLAEANIEKLNKESYEVFLLMFLSEISIFEVKLHMNKCHQALRQNIWSIFKFISLLWLELERSITLVLWKRCFKFYQNRSEFLLTFYRRLLQNFCWVLNSIHFRHLAKFFQTVRLHFWFPDFEIREKSSYR